MKTKLKFLAIGISLLMFNSCSTDDSIPNPQSDSIPNPQSNSINKIMPLGASRVEGDRPEYESYRYELWKDLIENSWTFDYIGTQSDGASYPLVNNRNFDIDHEGRGGWTSIQILNGINDWLAETGAPDIVLFSSPGGVDATLNLPYNQTLSNIIGIIKALQNANPDVTIIIEQMAPLWSGFTNTELTNYVNQLQQDVLTIASENSTTSSEVIAVDMFTDFTDDLLIFDGIHYNFFGANFIARRYYAVLENILEE